MEERFVGLQEAFVRFSLELCYFILQPSKVLKVVRTIDPSKGSELIGVDHVTTNRNWVMAVFVYTGRFLLHLTSKVCRCCHVTTLPFYKRPRLLVES